MSGIFRRVQTAFKGFASSIFDNEDLGGKKHYVGEYCELQDGQMKETSIDIGGKAFKVLLSRIAGQYYATSHLCTHYRARLVTGVLTGEGRIVCPWHAACFDVKSGDIEEAPAIEPLKTYPVLVEDEKVYVVADSKDFETTSKSICGEMEVDAPSDETLVIIGGGAAGAMAAESIRYAGFRGKVAVITKESHLPIDRIKLSKSLDAKVEKLLLHKPQYLEDIKVEYQLGKEAVGLNPKDRIVKLQDGTVVKYDKLLIATGGRPRTLPIPGAELDNIFVIRQITDNEGIFRAVTRLGTPKVVVVGASFIGMEAASMMSKVSRSVTIVAIEKTPLERVLGPAVGRIFQRLHEKNGVVFHLGVSITSFLPKHDDSSTIGYVELGDGTKIEADLVILGVGIRPETDFLRDVLPIEPDGGILVDANLRVKDHPNIFAAGDIARFPYFDAAHPIRIEHWDVALQQGRIAGRNMADSSSMLSEYDSIPFFFTMQYGKSIRYTGSGHEGYDEVFIDGDVNVDAPSFAAYYIRGERIVAVATMGRDPLAVHCGELYRKRKMPTATEVKAGKTPLSIPLN